MKFWNKGKVRPCIGYHIPNTPNTPQNQEFHSKTQGNLEWWLRNGDSKYWNKRILVVLDYSVLG